MKKRSLVRALALVCALLSTLGAVVCIHAAPDVSAQSAILMEAESGKVLFQKNAFVRLPMASTTKIMTAIVAIESGNIGRTVEISPKAVGVEGSSIYLCPGERLTLEQLLYALLLESANDAATAIAIEVAGSVEAFATLMNKKARDIGLTATHFTNPHGLDHGEHYTTAYDLAKLTRYALFNDTFRKMCATVRMTIPLKETEGTRVLINHNKMLSRYSGAIGVKTGFTKKSGRCLVSAAEKDGMTLIAVTLNAPNDWNDHERMLDFGFSKYKRLRLVATSEPVGTLSVTGGQAEQVTVCAAEELSALIPTDHGAISMRIEASRVLFAPIKKGDVLGKVIYCCDGKDVAEVALIANETVDCKKAERKGFFSWIKTFFFR